MDKGSQKQPERVNKNKDDAKTPGRSDSTKRKALLCLYSTGLKGLLRRDPSLQSSSEQSHKESTPGGPRPRNMHPIPTAHLFMLTHTIHIINGDLNPCLRPDDPLVTAIKEVTLVTSVHFEDLSFHFLF